MKPLAFALLFASLAAAQTCKVADFPTSGPVEGTLQRTDCLISDYLKDYSDLRIPAHAWKLVVKKATVYKIRTVSVTMDTYLLIADATGTIVDGDDDGAGGTDSELLMQLAPGEYTVLATVAFGGLGSYRLTGETSAVRTCRPTAVTLPSDTEAELTTDDCRYVDIIPMISSHSVVDLYSIESKQPYILTARMDSTAVDSYLGFLGNDGKVVGSDDNGGGGKNAKMRLSVAAGAGLIFASSARSANGTYRLHVESEDRRRCEVGTTSAGRNQQGTLDPEGCRVLDAFTGSSDESRMARYKFQLGQTVVVKLASTSTEFDTYLSLLDSNNRVLVENDNADRSTTNSAIMASLPAGTYTAMVRGLKNGAGAFELTLGTENAKTCEVTTLAVPGATAGALNATQCRYLDVRAPSTGTYAAQPFKFTLDVPTFVSLSATGTGYTPNIDIHNPAGDLVSTLRVTSKQDQLLLPGEYRVIAWHRTGTGNLNIAASTHEPVACPSLEIVPGTPATGTLNGLDCMLQELVPLPAGLLPADVYTLKTVDADTVTVAVTATKDEFLPAVYVLDADSKVVAAGIESVKFDAPAAAAYKIIVSTVFRGGGDYKVSVTGKVLPVE